MNESAIAPGIKLFRCHCRHRDRSINEQIPLSPRRAVPDHVDYEDDYDNDNDRDPCSALDVDNHATPVCRKASPAVATPSSGFIAAAAECSIG
jgi:hypothetical protein